MRRLSGWHAPTENDFCSSFVKFESHEKLDGDHNKDNNENRHERDNLLLVDNNVPLMARFVASCRPELVPESPLE